MSISDPMKAWLEANDIDIRRLVSYPKVYVEIGAEGVYEIVVEEFLLDDRDKPVMLLRTIPTRMVRYPMLSSPDEDMMLTYVESQPEAREQYEAERFLRSVLTNVTVIKPAVGDSLIFVTPHSLTIQQSDEFVHSLKPHLRGVNISVIGGFTHIIEAPKGGETHR